MNKGFISWKVLLVGVVLLIAAAAGVVIYIRGNSNKIAKPQHPEYLNFEGSYVFSVPKNYTVDEQSVPGAQLIFSGQITAKTLEDVYNAGGISSYAVTDLTDKSSDAFKKYVNDRFVPDLKKNLSVSDVQVKFGKANGAENVRIIAKKDGRPLRYIYIKAGQHPAAVIAKQESTSGLSDIEKSMIDVEKSDLKNEVESIKQAVKSTAELIKAQKAREVYALASPDFIAENTEAELANAMKAATAYTNGSITISGVKYAPNEISAAMRFTKLDKNDQQPSFGVLNFKKIDGQWKLQTLSLPTPKQQ